MPTSQQPTQEPKSHAPWMKHEGKVVPSYSAEASELGIRPGENPPPFTCFECSSELPHVGFIPQRKDGDTTHWQQTCACGVLYTIWND